MQRDIYARASYAHFRWGLPFLTAAGMVAAGMFCCQLYWVIQRNGSCMSRHPSGISITILRVCGYLTSLTFRLPVVPRCECSMLIDVRGLFCSNNNGWCGSEVTHFRSPANLLSVVLGCLLILSLAVLVFLCVLWWHPKCQQKHAILALHHTVQ